MKPVPPRLFVIVATEAPTALVFQRGPSRVWGLRQWDLNSGDLADGAVFRGTIYPRRCDLSPDGTLLSYFVMKPWPEVMGDSTTFSALSKSPWMFALAAWNVDGTWTQGNHFEAIAPSAEKDSDPLPKPDAGDASPLRDRHRLTLRSTWPAQYNIERRRGWVEDETSPPRGANDMWDERRSAVLTKPRTGPRPGKQRLVLTDHGVDFANSIEGRHPTYRLERDGTRIDLPNATWADWDPRGRLLMSTNDARLQIRDAESPDLAIVREHALISQPAAIPAPAWARTW